MDFNVLKIQKFIYIFHKSSKIPLKIILFFTIEQNYLLFNEHIMCKKKK